MPLKLGSSEVCVTRRFVFLFLTGLGIALQMRFFGELSFCLPVAKFVFEVTEAVDTFCSYNYSKAMTAEDLEGAYRKCVGCYSRFTETFGPDTGSTPDVLFAQ